MEERLSELYEGVAVHATADREHMAALELLGLVMLADSHLGDDESACSVSSPRTGAARVLVRAVPRAGDGRARQAWRDDTVDELLDDIDGRIASRILRRALFSAAREIAGVDDTITPEEGSILSDVAVRFG